MQQAGSRQAGSALQLWHGVQEAGSSLQLVGGARPSLGPVPSGCPDIFNPMDQVLHEHFGMEHFHQAHEAWDGHRINQPFAHVHTRLHCIRPTILYLTMFQKGLGPK